MRRTGPLLVVVLCVLGLAACSDDGSSSSSASKTTTSSSAAPSSAKMAATLRDTTWVLTDQASIGVPLGGITVSAVFDATQVTGTNGCNRYFASYTVSGTAMEIGPLGGTLIGCTGSAAAIESAYTRAWRPSMPSPSRVGR